MGAGAEAFGGFFCGDHGTDGRTASQGFGQGHDVRGHAVLLIGEEGAGTAAADLNFIEDQQQVVLIADLPYGCQVSRRRHSHTPFALHRFQHYRADLGSDGLAQSFSITEGYVVKTGQQRIEAGLDLVLAGGADGADGAAVKRSQSSDDLETIGSEFLRAVFAHQLHRRFVGFGAAVAEKYPVAEGMLAEQFGQFGLGGDMKVVGAVN